MISREYEFIMNFCNRMMNSRSCIAKETHYAEARVRYLGTFIENSIGSVSKIERTTMASSGMD